MKTLKKFLVKTKNKLESSIINKLKMVRLDNMSVESYMEDYEAIMKDIIISIKEIITDNSLCMVNEKSLFFIYLLNSELTYLEKIYLKYNKLKNIDIESLFPDILASKSINMKLINGETFKRLYNDTTFKFDYNVYAVKLVNGYCYLDNKPRYMNLNSDEIHFIITPSIKPFINGIYMIEAYKLIYDKNSDKFLID